MVTIAGMSMTAFFLAMFLGFSGLMIIAASVFVLSILA